MIVTPIPKDAALRIARFCWPKYTWKSHAPDFPPYTEEYGTDASRWSFSVKHFDTREQDCGQGGRYGIHAAEAVLIERGLGEEYAGELASILLRYKATMLPNKKCILLVAHAPKEARVRAMLTVIEEQESKK